MHIMSSRHELNRQGREEVAAELRRRGAVNVESFGTRRVGLRASSSDFNRTVELRIKTKQKGNWHASIEDGMPVSETLEEDIKNEYWVFVDLENAPRYWIIPDTIIRQNIFNAHEEYLKQHGGHRAINDTSNHHSIREERLNDWVERWDILGIF